MCNMRGMPNTPWYKKARALMKGKLTYDDLADKLDISASGVGHYLNGRRQPSIKQITIIARELGVSVSELCEDDITFVSSQAERDLLEAYRALPDTAKETALNVLGALSGTIDSKKTAK